MTTNVNIRQIAQRAGVSIATVSRALNNKGPLREETRQKILAIAQELDYRPNPMAQSLTTKQTNTIGLILPELVDEFFMNIIHSIDEEAFRASCFLMVASSHSQRNVVETLLDFMASGRVDGLILMAPQMNAEIVQLIRRTKRPIVLLNSSQKKESIVTFNINNHQGAWSVTEHLWQHGYRQIAMIQGPAGNIDAEERFRGYSEALSAYGCKPHPDLIMPGQFNQESGYYAFNRLMSQRNRPDAIFAANDMMAIGAFEAAKNFHLRIPEDIAVVGFDDIYACRLLSPRLTTVHVPINELGSKAICYLFRMISGEVDIHQGHHEEISTGLILGGSCGCQAGGR
jgi:DNA-binding LacI/PurR family transcriptional regulator